MKFMIAITHDEDGMFVAECLSIPGCVSEGKTEDAAQRNLRGAIKESLRVRAELGMPIATVCEDEDG